MYTLVSARLKERGIGKRWLPVAVGTMLMRDIYSTYVDGWFVLTNPAINGSVYVDLNTIRRSKTLPVRGGITFNAWLADIGNRALPTVPPQTITTTRIKYSDASRALYDVRRIHPTSPPSVVYPLGERKDLLLQKLGVQPIDVFENCMASVNGLWHITDYIVDGVKVKGGGRTVEIGNVNNVGLLSFRNIGKIVSIPFQEEDIVRPREDIPFKQSVWVKLNTDLTNKSVVLSLGGYLHVADGVCEVVNEAEGVIKINMNMINLLPRYFESKRMIDLSSLNLAIDEDEPDKIGREDLFSDDVIKAYLQLPQSFATVVDAPMLYRAVLPVGNFKMPGQYETYAEPRYPLRLRTGWMPEYWVSKQDGVWVMRVCNNSAPNYVFETTGYQNQPVVNDAELPANPLSYSIAEFLEIGCERRVNA